MRVARSFLPVIVVAALVACDPGDDPGGPAAEELVGTWVGPIDRTDVGMEASDTITMILGRTVSSPRQRRRTSRSGR